MYRTNGEEPRFSRTLVATFPSEPRRDVLAFWSSELDKGVAEFFEGQLSRTTDDDV